MADRVSVTIRIGGALPRAKLPEFVAAVEAESLTNLLGEYFSIQQITGLNTLDLAANEVAWGRLETLEAFCVEHRLPFERWCGCFPGGWEAERVVFDGVAEPRSYTATDNALVVATEQDVRALGTQEAVLAYFRSATLVLPPMTLTDGEEQAHG